MLESAANYVEKDVVFNVRLSPGTRLEELRKTKFNVIHIVHFLTLHILTKKF